MTPNNTTDYNESGDTRTPFKYSIMFTALNAILDPFFIFNCGFGASGAAAGTAIAQYAALIPLLFSLNRRVGIDILGQLRELGSTLNEYLKAGSYVLLRTIAKVLAYSVCARQAALLGSVAAAAYNLTFQLGFATTQICESVAVAVQTLLAREISGGDGESSREAILRSSRVRHCECCKTSVLLLRSSIIPPELTFHCHYPVINGSIMVGGVVSTILSSFTFIQRDSVLRGLTTDLGIREASQAIFFPVVFTQGKLVIFVIKDFRYNTY